MDHLIGANKFQIMRGLGIDILYEKKLFSSCFSYFIKGGS